MVDELVVDVDRRSATVGGLEVRLCAKEFDLLAVLAAAPHRVFTKAELLELVWGYSGGPATRTLDSHASRLRCKLDPDGHRFVFATWGVGYSLTRD